MPGYVYAYVLMTAPSQASRAVSTQSYECCINFEASVLKPPVAKFYSIREVRLSAQSTVFIYFFNPPKGPVLLFIRSQAVYRRNKQSFHLYTEGSFLAGRVAILSICAHQTMFGLRVDSYGFDRLTSDPASSKIQILIICSVLVFF